MLSYAVVKLLDTWRCWYGVTYWNSNDTTFNEEDCAHIKKLQGVLNYLSSSNGVSVHILPGSIRFTFNFLILSGKDVVRIPRSTKHNNFSANFRKNQRERIGIFRIEFNFFCFIMDEAVFVTSDSWLLADVWMYLCVCVQFQFSYSHQSHFASTLRKLGFRGKKIFIFNVNKY